MITKHFIQKHEWTVTWVIHTYHCFLSNWPVSAFFCTMKGSLLATTTMGEVAFTIILFNTCSLQSMYTNSSVAWYFWRALLCFLSCRCSRCLSNDNLRRRGSINTGHGSQWRRPASCANQLLTRHRQRKLNWLVISIAFSFKNVLRLLWWNSFFLRESW